MKKVLALVLAILMMALGGVMTSVTALASGGQVYEYEWLTVADMANITTLDENAEVLQELEKATGGEVKIKVNVVPSDSWDQRLQTTLASGDIPDIVFTTTMQANLYGELGAFAEISGLIEQYAPNLTAKLTPLVKYYNYTEGGKVYCFFSPHRAVQDETLFPLVYRQDILEAMGEKEPTTLDEWVTLWRKVKEQYPDMIPFGGTTNIREWLSMFGELVMDTDPAKLFYREGEEIIYTPTSPVLKEIATFLHTLYAEGLLDPDYMARTVDKSMSSEEYRSMMVSGQVFSAFVAEANPGIWNDVLKAQASPMYFMAALPPLGAHGNPDTYHVMSRAMVAGGVAFSADMPEDKLIKVIQYFDYWLGEEGQRMLAYGPEGVYTFADEAGNIRFKDEYMTAAGREDFLFTKGYQSMAFNHMLGRSDLIYDAQAALRGLFSDEPYWVRIQEIRNSGMLMTGENYEPAFTVEENEERSPIILKLNDSFRTAYHEFIMGKRDIETGWDAFVAEQKQLGCERALEIYNDANARLIEFLSTTK